MNDKAKFYIKEEITFPCDLSTEQGMAMFDMANELWKGQTDHVAEHALFLAKMDVGPFAVSIKRSKDKSFIDVLSVHAALDTYRPMYEDSKMILQPILITASITDADKFDVIIREINLAKDVEWYELGDVIYERRPESSAVVDKG